MKNLFFFPLNEYISSSQPEILPQWPDPSALNNVWIRPMEFVEDDDRALLASSLLFDVELLLEIPGLDAVKLLLAAGGGATIASFEVELMPSFGFRIIDVPIALRLSADLFRPVKRVPASQPGDPDSFEPDMTVDYVDIRLARVTLGIDGDGNVDLDLDSSIDLPLCMIGDSGVVIEASDIQLHLDHGDPPPGKPDGWRGFYMAHAALYLPGELGSIVGNLEMTDVYIGNGGFSGTVSDNWSTPLSTEFFGMTLELQKVGLTFVQNSLTASSIVGAITLPFFDVKVNVEIGFDLGGAFTIKLAATNGLYKLTKSDVLEIELDSLGLEVEDGVFTAKLSGKIKPLMGDFEWPAFDVKELSIDSDGNVKLDGGWLDLREQYMLDFYGFQLEITKMGFGKTEDGGKWMGFSGSLKLVDGLKAGASVEGLRITWYENGGAKFTFDGVGIEYEVPDVLSFKGAVAYREDKHQFDGAINFSLIALGLEIDSQLVVGFDDRNGYPYFAIYMGLDLPAGVPLWSTGLALYGMEGLFALSMEPDKKPDEKWYDMEGKNSWFHRGTPGVTDLMNKWTNRKDSLALGAGVTIGTVFDNGFTLSSRMLLVIVLPGPIIMLEGGANLLKERGSLRQEPAFRAMAVLDARVGTVLIGMDANYRFGDGGELIDIGGRAEGYFSMSEPEAWHLYLGQRDPIERRIRAQMLSLFQANAYFMLDNNKLAMGGRIGWGKTWNFDPVTLTAEAWIEGNAVISWNPAHLYGDLWLHGSIGFSVLWFSLGLSLDARIAANVFDPFYIFASLRVVVDLPWPIPDFDVTLALQWGDVPVPPLIPMPLKEVAIEHFKATTSWPLQRGKLLLPVYDLDKDGLVDDYPPRDGLHDAPTIIADPQRSIVPVVPLDARPHITFGRPVHDDAMAGVNPQPIFPEYEIIGNPEFKPFIEEGALKVRYGLEEIVLERWVNDKWEVESRASGYDPTTDEASDIHTSRLYGSWAHVPELPSGEGTEGSNTKLWLWSKNPFDYTRFTQSQWDEWFTERYPNYPCIPPPPDEEFWCSFEDLGPGWIDESPFTPPIYKAFGFSASNALKVVELDTPIEGKRHALSTDGDEMEIKIGLSAKEVSITVVSEPPEPASRIRVGFRHRREESVNNPFELASETTTFNTFDKSGKAEPSAEIHEWDRNDILVNGLYISAKTKIVFPYPSSHIRLWLLRDESDLTIRTFDEDGKDLEEHSFSGETDLLEVPLPESKIKTIEILSYGPTLLHKVCFRRVQTANSAVPSWEYDGWDKGVRDECIDFNDRPEGTVKNPLELGSKGVVFSVVDESNQAQDSAEIHVCAVNNGEKESGLFINPKVIVELPCPSFLVQLWLCTDQTEIVIVALDANGEIVQELPVVSDQDRFMLPLTGEAIKTVQIKSEHGSNYLQAVHAHCGEQTDRPIRAWFYDDSGQEIGQDTPTNSNIRFSEYAISRIKLRRGNTRMLLVQLCAVGPDPIEVQRREEWTTHLQNQLDHWSHKGAVLKPYSYYRLKIATHYETKGLPPSPDKLGMMWDYSKETNFNRDNLLTEYAYFQTAGPPGVTKLTTPESFKANGADEGVSLNDLSLYVKQTIPPTCFDNAKPILPRAVYRAYDVGVLFNEDYVDLMYRIAHRDLGLYLYDNNNRPVRDAQGRLIVLNSQWEEQDKLLLDKTEQRWYDIVSNMDCKPSEDAQEDGTLESERKIPHDNALTNANARHVLDADTLYQARLIPLLLRETFTGTPNGSTIERGNGWNAIDQGTNDGSSDWRWLNHVPLEGEKAAIENADEKNILILDGSPDLSLLEPGFDIIILAKDTATERGTYRILSMNDENNTVTVDGEPDLDGSSSPWEISQQSAIIQTSNIWGGVTDENAIAKPGAMYVYETRPWDSSEMDDPLRWTDYRFSVYVRSTESGTAGIVFRYNDDQTYYRFSIDFAADNGDTSPTYCRLVRFDKGIPKLLQIKRFNSRRNQDYLFTVEAVKSELAIYVDEELLFKTNDDEALLQGTIGLYCWQCKGALFSDVRVDDFRVEARVAYRFEFVTSKFAHFLHHMHSYDDETWLSRLAEQSPTSDDLNNAIGKDEEARAYNQLAESVLGRAANQTPQEVRVTRVERDGKALGLLIESPQPIDWQRTELALLRADQLDVASHRPGDVKLTGIEFGTDSPNEEAVHMLLRQALNLSGYSIQRKAFPGALPEPVQDPILFSDNFKVEDVGMLFRETFGADALANYTFDSGGWIVRGGEILYGRVDDNLQLSYSLALTGEQSWGDVRVAAGFRMTRSEDLYFVLYFRYSDKDNYYQLMSFAEDQAQLMKCVDGIITGLSPISLKRHQAQRYEVEIYAYGNLLIGFVNQRFIFSINDADLQNGCIGFVGKFDQPSLYQLDVEGLKGTPVLWQPSLDNLNELPIAEEKGANLSLFNRIALSVRMITNILTPRARIPVEQSASMPGGKYAIGGDRNWRDIQISARVGSTAQASSGIMFRYQDADNYYCFLIDWRSNQCRLVKKAGGNFTTLWPSGRWDSNELELEELHDLTIRAVGKRIEVYVDGDHWLTVFDPTLADGQFGLFGWGENGVVFDRLLILDRTRHVGEWQIIDDGTIDYPSMWQVKDGALLQSSNIHDSTPEAGFEKHGTYVVSGASGWTDYRLEARIGSDANGSIGVIFRYQDERNYYRLSIDRDQAYWRLVKVEDGVFSLLADKKRWLPQGFEITVTVDVIGSRLICYEGSSRLFDVNDSAHATGRIGLYGCANTGMRFESVEVLHPPLDAYALFRDRFMIGDITGWTIVPTDPPANWILEDGVLRQTAKTPYACIVAGEQSWADVVLVSRMELQYPHGGWGYMGLVFRYKDKDNYYAFTLDPLDWDAVDAISGSHCSFWRLIKRVNGVDTPLWEKRLIEFGEDRSNEIAIVIQGETMFGYLDGVPMFSVEDDEFPVGRIGLICHDLPEARFSNVRVFPLELCQGERLFSYDFNNPVPGIWDKDTTAGDVSWTDYRMTVGISLNEETSRAYLCFRYQDSDNYYYFRVEQSVDTQFQHRGLVKVINGAYTELWGQDDNSLWGAETHLLTIDCFANHIRVFDDGVEFISIDDGDLTNGKIGLRYHPVSIVTPSIVQVFKPVWSMYYVFRDDDRLAAGTRIHVHSANKMLVSDKGPNIQQRFVASLDDPGKLWFPGSTDLRIVDPSNRPLHTRFFLRPDAYKGIVDFRVLRKEDGTGFFIFVPSQSESEPDLPKRQYRLQMTYHRRLNSSENADSKENISQDNHPTLKESGDDGDESVILDIPWNTVMED